MLEYINNLNFPLDKNTVFWFCALSGSGIFFIQLLLNLFGFTEHEHGDITTDEVSDHRKFKWMSLQAIGGFLMMFGWIAITCQKEFNMGNALTIMLAFAAGLITVMITRMFFKLTTKLHSSGNIYNIDEAIGKEGYVYQQIPKGGIGKISIALQHLTYEIDAVSLHPEEIPSFSRVLITNKKDDSTVVVIKI